MSPLPYGVDVTARDVCLGCLASIVAMALIILFVRLIMLG